jgi:RNA polymerase sigma-70 factor, ECF subfamily
VIAFRPECNNVVAEPVLMDVGVDSARTRSGADERFRRLVVDQLPRLYRVARRLVDDEAEDAVQDCLLRAYRGYGRLADDRAAPAWLMRILVNCCRDRLRSRARRPEPVDLGDEEFSLFRKLADEDPFPYSDSLHLDFLQQFGPEDVRAVLAALPALYRTPLVLVCMEGYHVKEVAFMLGTPVGTMLARLHRGRKLFERELWTYAEANHLLREGAHP